MVSQARFISKQRISILGAMDLAFAGANLERFLHTSELLRLD